MRVLTVLILGLLIVCAVNGSVISDEVLTTSLQDVWYEDEFIIALSNIKHPTLKRKSSSNSIETLLAVKCDSKTKMVLILDRRTKRVVLESLDESGRRSAGHVNVDSLAVNTPLKSLLILVHQAQPNPRVDVYVDCIYEGSIPIKRTFRDIAETSDNPIVEVLRERRCQAKIYLFSSINEVLQKEKCPDKLIDMQQPSVFESNEFDAHNSQKPIDRPDGTDGGDGDDGINEESNILNQKNNLNLNSFAGEQSNGNRPDHRPHNKPGRPTKKPSHSHHSESGGAPDKYDPHDSSNPFGSPDPFSPTKRPDETDDFDHADKPRPTPSITFTLQFPEEQHRPTKRPDKSHRNERPSVRPNHQSGLNKPNHQSNSKPNGLNQNVFKPDGSNPYNSNEAPSLTSENSNEFGPTNRPAHRPNHQSGLNKPNHESNSKPNGLNQNVFQPDGSNPYNSNEDPSFTPENSNEFGPTNRPAHRPNSPSARPSQTNQTTKRIVRQPTYEPSRGDIGIQSLDEKECLTDSQIVKSLNELINVTRKLWRQLEQNRAETQHLRHLIENCSACRTPTVRPPPPQTCDQNSPCYPGAECRDTPSGPQCGSCPRGYTGNGRVCVKINVITCTSRPCFSGVRCYDLSDGYRCGRCPSGYIGDGERCERRRNPCDIHPCHMEVQCYPSDTPPYFK